jgi:hypothetical protein
MARTIAIHPELFLSFAQTNGTPSWVQDRAEAEGIQEGSDESL